MSREKLTRFILLLLQITPVAMLALLLVQQSLAAGPDNGTSAERDPTGVSQGALPRLREGTRITKQLGHFRATRDRLTFYVRDEQRTFPGLENLALERISKALSDRGSQPEKLLWEVSGLITENRGGNFLLVTHAILKSRPKHHRSSSAAGR